MNHPELREPDARHGSPNCEGLAHIVVGAEPGNVAGTKVIDAADLDKGLIKIPRLQRAPCGHLPRRGWTNVLVIVVEPRKWGDRTHTLRANLMPPICPRTSVDTPERPT